MSSKYFMSYKEFLTSIQVIKKRMHDAEWRPEVILGVSRGGLVPAVFLSHIYDIPMVPLRYSLRDHVGASFPENLAEILRTKKTLVVDDIFDGGHTFYHLNQYFIRIIETIVDVDWQYVEVEKNLFNANRIIGKPPIMDLRWATLYFNQSSEMSPVPDFYYHVLHKAKDDQWIIFPWENDSFF